MELVCPVWQERGFGKLRVKVDEVMTLREASVVGIWREGRSDIRDIGRECQIEEVRGRWAHPVICVGWGTCQ